MFQKSQRRLTPSSSVGAKDSSTQRAAAMAALSSQLTSEGKLSKAAQTVANQNSASAPVSPKVNRPSTAGSQRAAAMAALSSMLGPKLGAAASTVSGKGTIFWLFNA